MIRATYSSPQTEPRRIRGARWFQTAAIPGRADAGLADRPLQSAELREWVPGSEDVLERELDHTGVDARVHDLAEIRRGDVGQCRLIRDTVRVRVVELGVIQDIEELRPELQRDSSNSTAMRTSNAGRTSSECRFFADLEFHSERRGSGAYSRAPRE